jgi:hypothetical protein
MLKPPDRISLTHWVMNILQEKYYHPTSPKERERGEGEYVYISYFDSIVFKIITLPID